MLRYSHVWVLSDEIYEHLSYVPFTPFITAMPELRDRLLTVNGVSKSYSMTGWRIGWRIGPAALISAMGAVQGQITSGACSIAQAAALAALKGDQGLLVTRLAAMRARRDRIVAGLNAMPGVICPEPEGAFYVFPDLSGAIAAGGFASDADLCGRLLEEAGVAIVPGRAFGLPGHARISFAYAEADIADGIARIHTALTRRIGSAG